MSEQRVLIIEDERLVAIDLQELLEAAGYQTEVAHSSEEALEKAERFVPHLVLCDINLGEGATGIDCIRHLQQSFAKLEVIYITAFSSSEVIRAADETEPFNYIVKPYNDSQIRVAVQMAFNYLERSKKDTRISELSLSEFRVLELVAEQKTSKEIAAQLFIAEKTVRNHRYNIIKKLGLPNDKNSLLKWAIGNLK